MELPKVIIKQNYTAYLNGNEVTASLVGSTSAPLQPGAHVIAFKDSIAAASDVPVPKAQQAHYIGVEGTVTGIEPSPAGHPTSERQIVRVRKL